MGQRYELRKDAVARGSRPPAQQTMPRTEAHSPQPMLISPATRGPTWWSGRSMHHQLTPMNVPERPLNPAALQYLQVGKADACQHFTNASPEAAFGVDTRVNVRLPS